MNTIRRLVRGEALFRDLWSLRDVSLEVEKGEGLGLIGGNGSGKSTLMRIVAGILEPTSGMVEVSADPSVLFGAHTGVPDNLPLVDAVMLLGAMNGVSREVLVAQLDSILEGAQLSHLRFGKVKNLSFGQRMRFALSVLFRCESPILLFDEVLNGVDADFKAGCERFFERVRGDGRTLLLASHDPELISRHCDKVLWLDRGEVAAFGPAGEVLGAYRRREGQAGR